MANPHHLKILHQGVEEWNAWRSQEPTPDLSGANLTGRTLAGADFREANLRQATLGGDCRKVNLSRAKLDKAVLRDANLSGANLSQAVLCGATLDDVELNDAVCRSANFTKATLTKVTLKRSVAVGSVFSGCSISGSDFVEADLTGGLFTGAEIRNTDFSDAKLNQAELAPARCEGGVEFDRAELVGANLSEARFRGARLFAARLEGAKLTGIDLRGAYLAGANLKGSNLTDANLTGADLSVADTSKAVFVGADLSDAILVQCSFAEATLAAATLTNANVGLAHGLERARGLDTARFGQDHRGLEDASDLLVVRARDRWLNWGRLRAIGQFPLFGVSWFSLLASVTALNGIAWLNDTRVAKDIIQYPVPLPQRMVWLILSSLLLVIGSTIYRLACPGRVQSFSEEQFVEEHRHARLLYLAECWSRRGLQWPAALLTLIGGLSGLALAAERIWVGLAYALQTLWDKA